MLQLLLRRCGIKGTKPTVSKPAAAGELAQGELWLNNNHESPGLFARADDDTLIEFPSDRFLQDGTDAKPRTVLSKLKDVVSVKDYGAVGNGTADDTAAIKAAIAANLAGEIVFPAGSYKVATSISLNGFTGILRFLGSELHAGANNIKVFESTTNAWGARVIDARILGTGFTGVTGFDLTRCQLRGAELVRPVILDCEHGIYLRSLCWGLKITNPETDNVVHPITIDEGCNAITIDHPCIDRFGPYGIWFKQGTPRPNVGNTVFNGFVQNGQEGIVDQSISTQVIGTYFEGCAVADVSLKAGSISFSGITTNHTAGGAIAYKGVGADSASIQRPFMSNAGRPQGLLNFDVTCTHCFYDVIFGNGSVNLPLGTVAGIAPASNKPGPIGGITPDDGKFSTLSASGATQLAWVNSGSSLPTIAPNVATKMFTAQTGLYQVYAFVGFSGSAAGFTSRAVVMCDGSQARLVAADNGTNLLISLSGLDVQVTQTSGGPQLIHCHWLRMT